MNVLFKNKIKVAGVGGAGCAVVDALLNGFVDKDDCCLIDDDAKLLFMSRCANKISLDDIGDATEFAGRMWSAFEKFIDDAYLLVVVAGLGGSVGSVFAKHIVKIALKNEVATVVVAVKPFPEEGEERLYKFNEGYRELSECDCSVMLLQNCGLDGCETDGDLVKKVVAKNNEKILYAVKSIVGAFNSDNLDASDARAVFGGKHEVSFCYNFAEGKDKTQAAALGALSSPSTVCLPSDKERVIFYIRCNISATLDDVRDAVSSVHSFLQKDAYVFFAIHYDRDMSESLVQVALIAA